LSDGYIDELIEAGVDRLSIGIQSFDDEVLRFMNRAHNAEEALGCVQRAQRKGITNISIDLIYGVPKTNASYWEETVAKALSLNVKHISAYCLTIEAGTVFSNWKKNEKLVSLPEEEELAQFNLLNQELSNVGIHRYEVSNFGKTGYESMHNSAYWSQVPYLGIGPSAHSFNKVSRQWNVSHNRKYMDGVINNESFFESEVLQKEDVFNECLLTGLRTVQGVSLNQLDSTLITSAWREKLKGLVKEGVLSLENGFIAIEEGHLFRADGIAADLFVE
jgi:oxygen-independent coproporphyrinogen-3 oxidase